MEVEVDESDGSVTLSCRRVVAGAEWAGTAGPKSGVEEASLVVLREPHLLAEQLAQGHLPRPLYQSAQALRSL